MNGPAIEVDFAVFQQIDVRVGRVSSVEPAEGCRVPAHKLVIDFGPAIGTRRSIAQATNYPRESLVGRQVLAVVNFKPRQVGKHTSESPGIGRAHAGERHGPGGAGNGSNHRGKDILKTRAKKRPS